MYSHVMKEPFSDRFSNEPTWHNTLFHRIRENAMPVNSVSSSIYRNVITRLFALRRPRNLDVFNLSRAKPSPKREGWVRENTNMEKCQFKSPYPNLLPEGEGSVLLSHQHFSRKLEARHD